MTLTRLLVSFVLVTLLISACSDKKVDSRLHYTLTGTGDTTLVFIHGWGINGDYWNSQVEYFSPRYQILTLDLQGHGQSPARIQTINMRQYSEDVVQLLDDLGLKKMVLIGHSMSGNIVLRVYDELSDNVVGVVGIDNFGSVGVELTQAEKWESVRFFKAFREHYADFVRKFAGTLFVPQTDTLIQERVINDVLKLNSEFSISTLESLEVEYSIERKVLPKLHVPLLIIMQQAGMFEPSTHEELCGSGYNVWVYTGAGHYPMIEIPDTFNKLLAEAIRYRK